MKISVISFFILFSSFFYADNAKILMGCIEENNQEINSTNSNSALVAISSCLQGFVTDLNSSIEREKSVKNLSKDAFFTPGINLPFLRQGTEDSGTGNNVYYSAKSTGQNDGERNSGFGYGVTLANGSRFQLSAGKNSDATRAGVMFSF
tara:strand:- start:1256 stop:1702 length:447 start_codon:yes stop_codon:yes gene_type:complete